MHKPGPLKRLHVGFADIGIFLLVLVPVTLAVGATSLVAFRAAPVVFLIIVAVVAAVPVAAVPVAAVPVAAVPVAAVVVIVDAAATAAAVSIILAATGPLPGVASSVTTTITTRPLGRCVVEGPFRIEIIPCTTSAVSASFSSTAVATFL